MKRFHAGRKKAQDTSSVKGSFFLVEFFLGYQSYPLVYQCCHHVIEAVWEIYYCVIEITRSISKVTPDLLLFG